MKIIHAVHPEDFVKYNTQQIREKFLLDKLVETGKINCVYTHYDRMIVGAATPSSAALKLETYDQLKSENFLDRREMGIINIGATGSISVEGVSLTVGELNDPADQISVWLIPETLAKTNLSKKAIGDKLNIEVDVLAKYVERLIARGQDRK